MSAFEVHFFDGLYGIAFFSKNEKKKIFAISNFFSSRVKFVLSSYNYFPNYVYIRIQLYQNMIQAVGPTLLLLEWF